MDYEKKYKELLDKAKKLHDENCDGCKVCLETLYPELAEDEEIRQAMINFFKSERIKDGIVVLHFGVNIEKMITWLEKQGKQKEYTFKSLPRLLDMIEPTEKAKAYCQKLINVLIKEGYVTDAKVAGECLKQMNGENVALATMDNQKINKSDDERIRKTLINFFTSIDEAYAEWEGIEITDIIVWLEKQGEQQSKWTNEDMD